MARLHEYQGKELLKQFKIPVPKGGVARSSRGGAPDRRGARRRSDGQGPGLGHGPRRAGRHQEGQQPCPGRGGRPAHAGHEGQELYRGRGAGGAAGRDRPRVLCRRHHRRRGPAAADHVLQRGRHRHRRDRREHTPTGWRGCTWTWAPGCWTFRRATWCAGPASAASCNSGWAACWCSLFQLAQQVRRPRRRDQPPGATDRRQPDGRRLPRHRGRLWRLPPQGPGHRDRPRVRPPAHRAGKDRLRRGGQRLSRHLLLYPDGRRLSRRARAMSAFTARAAAAR